MANDENVLKKKTFNFYKAVCFINYQANLVPRVSHLPVGGKMRDPGNKVSIKYHPSNCSHINSLSNDSYLCVQTS